MSNRLIKKLKISTANKKVAPQIVLKFQQALTLQQQGLLSPAQFLYEEILKLQPHHFDALCMLALIAIQTKNFQRAVALFDKAILINPNNAVLYFNRGKALQELNQLDAAVASYDKAIAFKHDYAGAYLNRGNALSDLKQLEAALASYSKALSIEPGFAAAYNNRGLTLQGLKQLDAALADFDEAIAIKPDYAEAYYNRGLTLQGLRHLDAALVNYDRAIALKPDYAEAHDHRGLALQELNQFDAALASFEKAIAIKPDYAEAHANRAYALYKLNQHKAAIVSYDKVLAIKPDYDFLYGVRLHIKMRICDWSDRENQLSEIIEKIQRNEKVSPPFLVLSLTDSLSLQLKAATIFEADQHPASFKHGKTHRRSKREKIRLGYFSMDFKNHAVSFLTAELFEIHDRKRFEVIAFSFGLDTKDEMRQRLEGAFDKFIDVSDKSDKEIAEMAQLMEIDIAIDLAGFTAGFRADIFALRAAPIQVNFIGYPGTMGTVYMDYLIADRQVIPEAAMGYYSEKIVYLPCYQPNDRKRKISDRIFTREELGLPNSGFVFCCFNNNYKITPNTFDGWMRILKRVDGSALWLYEDNPAAADNLRREAVQRGIDGQRLVFAKVLPSAEYLARFRCANLFLDTLPFNAGTTASDALWAGLPVLTCTGEAFAGRMATSLLTAIDMPELITNTQEDYEALAVELATNPERLRVIRQKLERNRLTTMLFDSKQFTKNIEDAYAQMYERYQDELPPDHIYV